MKKEENVSLKTISKYNNCGEEFQEIFLRSLIDKNLGNYKISLKESLKNE